MTARVVALALAAWLDRAARAAAAVSAAIGLPIFTPRRLALARAALVRSLIWRATDIDVQQCVRFRERLARLLGAMATKLTLQGRPAIPLSARRLIPCGSIASSVSSRRQKWW